ncbi:uncharacterized protein LOC135845345 [Planococcus citri]|uniref:uncharacterized protein LOC135845345 n=1 Tax=Planococcus citri TaxID=170843 RepID=UPI0031F9F95F
MFKKAPFVILLIINCGIHSLPTNITNSHEQESNFNSNHTETDSTPKLDIPEENDEYPKESESSTPQLFKIPEDESEKKPSTSGYYTTRNKEDSIHFTDWQVNPDLDWPVDPDLNASSTSQSENPESESERNKPHSTSYYSNDGVLAIYQDGQQVNSDLDASSTPQPKIPQGEPKGKPSTRDKYLTIRIDLSQSWRSRGGATIDLQNEGRIEITV